MTEHVHLGKIDSISFGYGGCQDAMIGLSVSLSWKGGGTNDFKGTWGIEIKTSKHSKWDEEDRDDTYAETFRFINTLLRDANKHKLEDLKGIPVEITIENSSLKSWRVLTEVI